MCGLDGQEMLHLNTNNKTWTEGHSGYSKMKEEWDEDQDLANFFSKNSQGDCMVWLQQFSLYWKETPKPTGK